MRDEDSARAHFAKALDALGLTGERDPELARTAARFIGLLTDFAGLPSDPELSAFDVQAPSDAPREPVLITGVEFHSLCVHHLVPFFGTIDVAYVPRDKIVGFGSIARVIEHYSKRPQVQERLVEDIAQLLQRALDPEGLIVRCRARQMCMEMRGAKKRAALVSTASRGSLIRGTHRDEIIATWINTEQPL